MLKNTHKWYAMQIIGEMYIKFGLVLLKIGWAPFIKASFGSCFTKNPSFGTPKMENVFLHGKIENSPMDHIVYHSKMHICSHFGKKLTNYAMHVAITLVVCPKTMNLRTR
jgi:hypothetical protein